MNENIKAFLQKLAADEALQAQFKGIKDPDKAYELAASVQGGFSKDEFFTTMKELKSQMSRDLSDDDLEKAAGGDSTTPEITGGIMHTIFATIEAAAEVGASAAL
jgi:predicted ribosomally synthesized peptide with nif11-like leader